MNEHLLAAQANIVGLFTHWLRWHKAGFSHIFWIPNPQPTSQQDRTPIDPLTSGQRNGYTDSTPRGAARVHLPRLAGSKMKIHIRNASANMAT